MVRRLGSPEGHELLATLPDYAEQDALALAERLRAAGHPAALVAAALSQQRLRSRARAKFGEFADGMLYTPDGLEQASRLEVAAAHAGRYAAASLATVHDLGCGIGSDAMAMSSLGVTVHGVDADPVTAAVADVNLRPWPDSRARPGRAEDVELPPDAARGRVGVWLDPARRLPGVADARGRTRRVFRLEDLSPSWEHVLAVAALVPATGAKLSPSLPHDVPPPGTEAQWTSWNGQLLECAVWWGPLAGRPGRSARVLRAGAEPVVLGEDAADPDPPAALGLASLGAWLYEPDRAVTRAGLVGAATALTSGAELEPGLGYVTSDRELDLAWARRHRVREVMPFNVKRLRAWLREHGVTGLTVKKRGVRLDEDALRRQLRVSSGAGSGTSATVLLTRVAGTRAALVLDPA